MTTSMNRQPQGIPVGGQFATTAHSEPECGIPAPAATSGPEFTATMLRLENDFHEGRRKVQHGYVLMAVNEMKQQCPDVASFTLTWEDDLEPEDILDADGDEVSDADCTAMRDVWHYRDEADYSQYIGEEIDVKEILETWQPHGEAPGEAPTSGPEFIETMQRLESDFFAARLKVQHGYMLMAANEMQEQCPDVASFTLTDEDDLDAEDILNADGGEVSDEDCDAMRAIWHYRDEADYSQYIGEEINLQEIRDTWKP